MRVSVSGPLGSVYWRALSNQLHVPHQLTFFSAISSTAPERGLRPLRAARVRCSKVPNLRVERGLEVSSQPVGPPIPGPPRPATASAAACAV